MYIRCDTYKDNTGLVRAGWIKITCFMSVLFWVVTQPAFCGEGDNTIRSSTITAPTVIIKEVDKAKRTNQSTLQTKEPIRVQEPQLIRERTQIEVKPFQVKDPKPSLERKQIEVKQFRVEDPKKLSTQKKLDLKQQTELRKKLSSLKLETNRVRNNKRQLELQMNEKQRTLSRTTQPVVKQQLQLEMVGMQKQLNLFNDQINNLEGEQQTILMQITTGSQGFEDPEDHLGRKPSPCFIATAAYGSPLAKEVMTLRQFRDRYLITNQLGRQFIEFYYDVSPPIAAVIAKHKWIRSFTQFLLWPVVAFFQYPIVFLVNLCFFLTLFLSLRQKKQLNN